jgi:nucleoside-diphosphate-sugar epimerase
MNFSTQNPNSFLHIEIQGKLSYINSAHLATHLGVNMRKSIVIFGASGFIGTHFLRHFQNIGDYNLLGVDLASPKNPVPPAHYIINDVRDLSGFDVEGEIDLIINLATFHKTPGHPAHAYYETNILGAIEVCKFARRKSFNNILFTARSLFTAPAKRQRPKRRHWRLSPLMAGQR